MLFLVAFTLLLACGYRPLRSGLSGNPRIRVARTISHLPGGDGAAVAEAAANGARAELARFGALSADESDIDLLTIEIVRIDEKSEGIAVFPAGSGNPPLPPFDDGKSHARGVRLRVTARGLVAGHGKNYETIDLEATEVIATAGTDVLSWEAARTAAARGAARKVGAMIAREVLGVP